MKKTLIGILILTLLTLASCTKTVEITRYEEQPRAIGRSPFFVYNVDNERVIEYYGWLLERENCGEIYIPAEGSFVTEDGESFVSSIKEKSMTLTTTDGYAVQLIFTLEIHSPEGELIISEKITCNEKRIGDTIPEPSVSAEMAKYWNTVKTPATEYLGNAK